MLLKLALIGMTIYTVAILYEIHVQEQMEYISHEKAKIAIEKEALSSAKTPMEGIDESTH